MRAAALLLAALAVGCIFEPSEEWVGFEPPDLYRAWHGEVELCVGGRRAFDDLTWRKVHAPVFHCDDDDDAIGCFAHPSTIYLAESVLHSEWTVKIELIHYVRQNGLHDDLALQCRSDRDPP